MKPVITTKEPSLFAKIFLAMLTPWTSQRLWLAIVCISVLVSLFWTAVYYLYSIPSSHVATFDSMFQTTAWAVTAVVIGYILDMPTLLNGFKRAVISNTSNVVQNLLSKEEVKCDQDITVTERYDPLIEKKYADRYVDDISYQPPATVPEATTEVFR